MTSTTTWIRDSDGKEHPEDSVLLAYVRRQQLEDRLSINRHINVEQCPRCRHKCDELAQTSATLDVLGQMGAYQHYPELPAATTFSHVQGAANKQNPLRAYVHWAGRQQRPRKSIVRLISLPLAFGLALLCVVLVLAAHWPGGSLVMEPSQGGTSPSQSNATALQEQHTTPTPDLALTATARASSSPTPALTPTASPGPQPYLKVCSTPADIAQLRLVICGFNFEPGHKLSLVVDIPGKQLVTRHPVLVDEQGEFQDDWYIYYCGNLPAAIFAEDMTAGTDYSYTPVNISFANCSAARAIETNNWH
jgi:hypothetical protein